jgi:uncharacterized protein (DUF1697 family)
MAIELAFLRAVNVGGHAILEMSALRRIFESAGCTDVRTFIQSGNVIYRPTRPGGAALHARIGRALARHLGHEVAIAYRTARALQSTIDAAPFASLEGDSDLGLYVGFLTATPKRRPRLPLSSPKDGLEIIDMAGGDLFVVSRKVKGRSGSPNLLIERELAVPATTRNWNTVRKMLALATGSLGDGGPA